MAVTDSEKAEILREYRFMKKDKNTVGIIAQLHCLDIEEVENMVKGERAPAFKWTPERVHRLKAYIAQGMGNTAIANELGCKVQCVADYKRTHKSELGYLDKKKEPSAASTDESSKKNVSIATASSANDYNTDNEQSQEVSEGTLWSARYMELSRAHGEALSSLYESEAFLTAAVDAGHLWGCTSDVSKLQNYIEMYRVLCERALEGVSNAVEIMEKD